MTDTIHPSDGPQLALSAGPLADLTVVDLTRALAGPHAAMMLGDLAPTSSRSRVPLAVTTPAAGGHRSSNPPGQNGNRPTS